MQDVCCGADWNDPGAQFVQRPADGPEKVPASHAVQVPAPGEENVPAPQPEQLVDPAVGANKPASQAAQLVEPAFEAKRPGGHVAQLLLPASGAAVPGEQGEQLPAPAEEKKPGMQSVQLAWLACAEVPEGHCCAALEPGGHALPAGQGLDVVPPGQKEPPGHAAQAPGDPNVVGLQRQLRVTHSESGGQSAGTTHAWAFASVAVSSGAATHRRSAKNFFMRATISDWRHRSRLLSPGHRMTQFRTAQRAAGVRVLVTALRDRMAHRRRPAPGCVRAAMRGRSGSADTAVRAARLAERP